MSPVGSHQHKANSPVKAFIAGGVSGLLEILITFPTEFVKTQLQLNERSAVKTKMSTVISETFKTRGFFGFYRGSSPVIIFSIPKSMIRFTAFEKFKALLQGGEKIEHYLVQKQRWLDLVQGSARQFVL